MWLCFIFIVGVASCYDDVEFSSRPNNASLLLLHFTSRDVNGPVFLGTFGLWSLMAGLSFGAHGDTFREIFRGFFLLKDVKKFNSKYKNLTDIVFKSETTGVTVTNSNYFFSDNAFSVLSDFRTMLQESYDTSFKTISFQSPDSVAIVNQYISQTSPLIRNLFTSDDFKETYIIMTNVLYFKGQWSFPFNTSNTRRENVRSSKGVTGVVDMMHLRAKVPYSRMESMKAAVTELPFGTDGHYCLLLITPDPNVTVSEVYKNFEKVTFKDIFDKLQGDGTTVVDVKLPKFLKISRLQLKKPLNNMGIYDAFEPTSARFGYMAREPIYIGTIEQNAVIAVREEGTVAYATIPGINADIPNLKDNESMPPLIYFIIEKSTITVLFGGLF